MKRLHWCRGEENGKSRNKKTAQHHFPKELFASPEV
jgi:hypothetical protein